VAQKAGHEVTVIDCQAEKLTYDTFRDRIANTPADVMELTATTLLYKSAMRLVTITKEVKPEARHKFMGVHMARSGTKTPSTNTPASTSSSGEKANKPLSKFSTNSKTKAA
jgi:hypothetical protein